MPCKETILKAILLLLNFMVFFFENLFTVSKKVFLTKSIKFNQELHTSRSPCSIAGCYKKCDTALQSFIWVNKEETGWKNSMNLSRWFLVDDIIK